MKAVNLLPEEEREIDDEFIDQYRVGFLEGYETGLFDGRNQGREAALFLIKVAFANSYEDDVKTLVDQLGKVWGIE